MLQIQDEGLVSQVKVLILVFTENVHSWKHGITKLNI